MRFAIKDAANILMVNKADGKVFLYSEDANSFDLKFSADEVHAKAKGNKCIGFDGEVTAELKMEFEVIQFKHLAIMASSDVETPEKYKAGLFKKVTLDESKKATIKGVKPVEGSVSAFKLDPIDGQTILGKELTVKKGDDSSGGYVLDLSADESVKQGDLVLVYYMEEKAKINLIKFSTKSKSPNFKIEADVAYKAYDGKMMALHMTIHNAKAKKNAELSLSTDNPSKFPMELDIFPDINGDYIDLVFLDDEKASISSLVEKLDPKIKLK